MNSLNRRCLATLILFAALAIPVRLAALDHQDNKHQKHVRYTVTDLGTLGGGFGEAWGVNNRGSMAGHSTLRGDQTYHAFFWQKGVITDLGTLGGPNSNNSGNSPLNDRGAVSGFSDTSTPDPNGEDFCGFRTNLICLPFVWEKGVMTALPTLGGNNGQAGGINNQGEIVGVSETSNSDPCSFAFLQVEATIWRNGNVQELPPFPGDSIGSASAINDAGQVVGASGCVSDNIIRAVLWQHGTPIDLGNLGGVNGNIAFDISNRGQVVGQSDLPADTTHHAFLWTKDEGMQDLGTLPGIPGSLANGINIKGQVVGFSDDFNGNTVALFWQNGVMTDLNTLIPPNSPLFLLEALSINDRGQIAGFGQLSDGEHRGFLLTPCYEHHDDDQGCEDEGEGTAVVRGETNQRPNVVFPEDVRRMLHQRLGSRYHIPGLGTPKN
jgi:probable HAF family extracellular repeat protein